MPMSPTAADRSVLGLRIARQQVDDRVPDPVILFDPAGLSIHRGARYRLLDHARNPTWILPGRLDRMRRAGSPFRYRDVRSSPLEVLSNSTALRMRLNPRCGTQATRASSTVPKISPISKRRWRSGRPPRRCRPDASSSWWNQPEMALSLADQRVPAAAQAGIPKGFQVGHGTASTTLPDSGDGPE